MRTRIVGWDYCPRAGTPGGAGYVPMFALHRPQLILETLVDQIFGKLRRCRLMSESNKLQPYQMTVYVLNRAYDYQGEHVIGVYADPAIAVEIARRDAVCRGQIDSPDQLTLHRTEFGEYWAGSITDSTQWYVRPFEITTEIQPVR